MSSSKGAALSGDRGSTRLYMSSNQSPRGGSPQQRAELSQQRAELARQRSALSKSKWLVVNCPLGLEDRIRELLLELCRLAADLEVVPLDPLLEPALLAEEILVLRPSLLLLELQEVLESLDNEAPARGCSALPAVPRLLDCFRGDVSHPDGVLVGGESKLCDAARLLDDKAVLLVDGLNGSLHTTELSNGVAAAGSLDEPVFRSVEGESGSDLEHHRHEGG